MKTTEECCLVNAFQHTQKLVPNTQCMNASKHFKLENFLPVCSTGSFSILKVLPSIISKEFGRHDWKPLSSNCLE